MLSSTALLAVGSLALTACGGGGTAVDLDAGKASFTANCSSCHALAKAKSGSVAGDAPKVGPNLDDAFRAARQQGFQNSEFETTVRKWIEIAPQKPGRIDQNGGNAKMARNIVVDAEADNVAAYVASVAGTDNESAVVPIPKPQAPATETTAQAPPAGGTTLELNAAAEALAFDKASLTAAAGSVTINLKNPSSIPHNIAIKGGGITPVISQTIGKDGVATATADLKPGTYEYYCEVPGHEGAGMKGTLTVTPDDTPPVVDPGAAAAAPVGGVQTVALPENTTGSTAGPRIVGPWLTLQIRDRRFSRLTAPVAARSFKIYKYVKPGYWIRIDPK